MVKPKFVKAELKNGEVTSAQTVDNKLSAAGLFGGFSSTSMGGSSSFPFGMPSNSEETKRESAPQTSGNSLDIPEFLNPKNRL